MAYEKNRGSKGCDRGKKKSGWFACRYNPEGVACRTRKCDVCGHNPQVAKDRLLEYRRNLREVTV